MNIEQMNRRAVIGTAATSLAALSGCSAIRNILDGRKIRVQTDLSTRSGHPYLEDQSTLEAAPAADGWLVTDPEWMDTNIRWDHLRGEEMSLRRIQGNIDTELFLTIFVGALPYRYGLGGFSDYTIENQTIHFDLKPTQVIEGGRGHPDDPEYRLDYRFILWRLLNDTKRPTEMTLDANFEALETTSRPEETE